MPAPTATRTVNGKWRPGYGRFGGRVKGRLEACLLQAGVPARFVTLSARESAVDWQGSFYRMQIAEFVGESSGWRYGDVIYPTLLRAVRAALAANNER